MTPDGLTDTACRFVRKSGAGDHPVPRRAATGERAAVDGRADAPELRFPLDLAFCTTCSLVQLTVSVPPSILFEEYPYFSSYSDTVVANANDLVERLVGEYGLDGSDLAMEIASNDGYLLQHYHRCGVPVLGVDPARNVVTVAMANGVPPVRVLRYTPLADELGCRSACVDTACEQRVGPRARGRGGGAGNRPRAPQRRPRRHRDAVRA